MTERIQRRWVRGYLVVWTLCLLVVGRRKSAGTRAAATGVMVPGGGFLYLRRFRGIAWSLAGVLVGFVAWFLVGMMFAPFLVWGATAGLAARSATRRGRRSPAAARPAPDRPVLARPGPGRPAGKPDWALIAAVFAGPAVLAANGWIRRRAFRRDQRRRERRNEQLDAHPYAAPTRSTARPGCAELTTEQLAFSRYILDRALQPLDRFDGFEWFDQFREAAVRYQLNYAQWALALSQYRCTPAFSGYLAEAQRRLIEKMTARRVWEYWWWENLWGNFRADPDPIRRDNVMLSGYYGVMLGTYASLTGDFRYDEPGCLEFHWNRRKQFRYDAPGIARIVHDNMARTGYGLFPCEPNWVYSACNMIGYAGLVAHDAGHGTGYADDLLDRFRESIEFEFSRADGRPITVRASRAGISVPGIGASTVNEAATAFWLSPVLHDVATRHWLLTRDNVVGRPDGTPCWQSPVIDRMDLGNYRMTWGPITYSYGLAAAREMGDSEAVAALEKSLAEVAPVEIVDGVAQFPGSTTANLMMGIGLLGGERAWHDLVAYGLPREQHSWPVLERAPYPGVLVARAASDGTALDLVLYPGNGPGPFTLTFGRLAPNRTYAVQGTGETVTTDARGQASIDVVLDGRRELRIAPQ